MFEPIDMYHYLANEALVCLQKSQSLKNSLDSSNSDEEEVSILEHIGRIEDFMEKISEIKPELAEITADHELVDRLHKLSEENQASFQRNQNRSNERGGFRSNQRGSGNFDRRGRGRGGYSQDHSEDRRRFSDRSYHSRQQSADHAESRGRYSVANQRDMDRGERQTNWRPRDKGNESKPDYTNWRQK